jgi:hypothetical protein
MVSRDHKLSVRRQCVLLTLSRFNLYYHPQRDNAENLRLIAIIDKQALKEALTKHGTPEIFNADQDSQFTSLS